MSEKEAAKAYSLVRIDGRTHQLSVGDTVDLLLKPETGLIGEDSDASDTITFSEVLLTKKEGGDISVGTPLVEGASVQAKILGSKKSSRVIAYKKRRRQGYHKKIGHRQSYVTVEVTAL